MSVSLHGTTGLSLGGFARSLIFEDFFRKSVDKIQVLLKSDKNSGYFACGPMYFYAVSRQMLLVMRNV